MVRYFHFQPMQYVVLYYRYVLCFTNEKLLLFYEDYHILFIIITIKKGNISIKNQIEKCYGTLSLPFQYFCHMILISEC